jgi:hypothetical protein
MSAYGSKHISERHRIIRFAPNRQAQKASRRKEQALHDDRSPCVILVKKINKYMSGQAATPYSRSTMTAALAARIASCCRCGCQRYNHSSALS